MDCQSAPGRAEAARLGGLLTGAQPGLGAADATDYCARVLLQLQYLLVAAHNAAQAKANEAALSGVGCLPSPMPAASAGPSTAAAATEATTFQGLWDALYNGAGFRLPVDSLPPIPRALAALEAMRLGQLPASEPPADAKTNTGSLLRFVTERWMLRLACDYYLLRTRSKVLSRDQFVRYMLLLFDATQKCDAPSVFALDQSWDTSVRDMVARGNAATEAYELTFRSAYATLALMPQKSKRPVRAAWARWAGVRARAPNVSDRGCLPLPLPRLASQAERKTTEKGDKKAKLEKCKQFNEKGSCQWGVGCNRAHKCFKCNGEHPAIACPKTSAVGGGSKAPEGQ